MSRILFTGGGSPGSHPEERLRGLVGGGGRVSRPTPRGEVEGSGKRGSPGPHPDGRLRGLGQEEGLQAHTWGSSGPHPGGVSRPTPRGSPVPNPGGC